MNSKKLLGKRVTFQGGDEDLECILLALKEDNSIYIAADIINNSIDDQTLYEEIENAIDQIGNLEEYIIIGEKDFNLLAKKLPFTNIGYSESSNFSFIEKKENFINTLLKIYK